MGFIKEKKHYGFSQKKKNISFKKINGRWMGKLHGFLCRTLAASLPIRILLSMIPMLWFRSAWRKLILLKLSGIVFDRRNHVLLTIINDMLNRDKNQEYNKRKFYPCFHPHGIKKVVEFRGFITYAVIRLSAFLLKHRSERRWKKTASSRSCKF